MLAMLSEASIASWCSPSQASPSYTPSRRRLRLRHWCSPKQISLVQTPRAEISRLALAGGSMLLQNLASSLSKVLFTTQLASELALRRLQCGFCPPGPGRRRSALYGMPPASGRRQNSFEFYGEPSVAQRSCPGASVRSHRQLRDATASKTAAPQDTAARHRTVSPLPQRAAHARSEQDSCRQKGCPTRHASSHHGPADRGPWGS